MVEMSEDKARELLGMMRLIRRFEEACAERYAAADIRGFLHLSIGQEAVAVGVMDALGDDDAVVATYREHGQALAKGLDAGRVMAEMFGKVEGYSRGRGGSMHIFSAEDRFYGGHAIVGAGLPMAVGLGLADKMLGRERVTACFFGEGAVAEGVFHESMNLAALWKVPVVFCCENNLYAMGTALDRSESQPDVHLKAASYGVPSAAVDGMDVGEVRAQATQAVGRARGGEGPQFLECRTYRFRAHSMFDPQRYRDRAEIDRWKERDPIELFERKLLEASVIGRDDVEALGARAEEVVREALAFAEQGRREPVEELERFVYTPREQR